MQRLPTRSFAAFLFDMDGTILTSILNAERHWGAWARRHGLDVEAFLPTIHGVQTAETIRRLGLPGVDPESEARAITDAEIADLEGVAPIDGAAAFLDALPVGTWTIVTSAPRRLAQARLAYVGMTLPDDAVTAEDVTRGKPSPDCFLLAAERLGVPIADCLVFEDAPAGIAAAEASGAQVAVLTATHRHTMETTHATLRDYAALDLDAARRLMLAASRR